jgi:hypothetical protein
MNHFGNGVDLLLMGIDLLGRPWLWVPPLVLLVLLATAWGRNLLLVLLIGLDCLVNVLCGGTIHETLSSRAHRMRRKGQPYWGWTAAVIDKLFFFQTDHCRRQYELEVRLGWHQ